MQIKYKNKVSYIIKIIIILLNKWKLSLRSEKSKMYTFTILYLDILLHTYISYFIKYVFPLRC
jgi:hypothetical protein